MRLAGCSLNTTVRHPLPTATGRIHASIVMAVVRSSEFASGIVTQSLTPSKLSAPPDLPVVRVGPEIVPALPLPEASVTVAVKSGARAR
jgi:hypothetical protein